ncbi:MAG: DegT/DnrJ/EryC1/StrS family aminotransferase [Anaerolineales bacterium]
MTLLALFGGNPILSQDHMLEDTWPETLPEDMNAVQEVFDSGQFTGLHNSQVEALEQDFSRFTGAKYSLALGTGTASLHAAVSAAGCQPGDEVIVPALTFLASASAVLQHLSIPVFVDIDPQTYNIDPQAVESKISPRTRAIMAVDMHGLPADYDALRNLAAKHSLVLIADAAHSVGATYKEHKVGNLADITGTSIMQAKQLATCGEGGLFTTNEVDYYNRASMVRLFGEVIRKGEDRAYNAYTLGWNYRLNPVQAAYARSQLKRQPLYTQQFSTNGDYLAKKLSQLPGIIPPYIPAGSTHVYHMFRIRFDPSQLGLDVHAGRFTQAVSDAMQAEGLPLRFYQFTPVPGQTIFRHKQGFGHGIPWTLPDAQPVTYDIEDYPSTLEVLENTRCIGKSGTSGPNYFRNRSTMDAYIQAFEKIWDNLDALIGYANKVDYQPPWSNSALSTRGNWVVMAPNQD